MALHTLPQQQAAIRAMCVHPSGRFVAFAKDEIEQSIADRFEKQERHFPERLAVKCGDKELTYRELNLEANGVAVAILDQLGEDHQAVGLLFGHDTASIASVLGVLKAGKSYVPLDPSHPLRRLRHILEDSRAGLILTDNSNVALGRSLATGDVELINIDSLDSALPHPNPRLAILPDTLAYTLYTSGSTGEPKGVVDNNRNVLHQVMLLTNDLHVCADDRVAHLHSFGFSASVRKIFPALLNGASIHMWDVKLQGVEGLGGWLIQSGITIFGGRAVIRDAASSVIAGQTFPDLRVITFGGDSIYLSDVELYRNRLAPNATFLISFATTETGTISHYFIGKDSVVPGPIVPVGYPVADKQVVLLDGENGEAGEIAVKSRYLSPGYWRRPELTRMKFQPDRGDEDERLYLTGDLGRILPDGCLMHMGRSDFQVKIRGYTVEVAETEAALLGSGMVKDAVVVGHENGAGNRQLVAYVVPAEGSRPTVSALHQSLSERLPKYMIPSAFVVMDALPRTSTDKVDRRALPAPERARPALETAFVAPRTPVEDELARTWAEVLDLDGVGVCDDFLELGGHSLAASQVISRVISAFGVKLSVKALFESPTITEMAIVITQARAEQADHVDVSRMLAEVERLSDR